MLSKVCSKCKKEKWLTGFNNRLGKKRPQCKTCERVKAKKYYSIPENIEKRKKQVKKYNNKPEVKEKSKEHKRKPKYKTKRKEYDNSPEVRKRKNQCKKERIKNDPIFKLKENIRSSMGIAIKKQSTSKSDNTFKLVGCTGKEAYEYLLGTLPGNATERDFIDGKLHIDHIRPCASFDLSDPKQQKECFSYKNLQLLWASDNISKNSKWEGKKHYHKKEDQV